MSSSPHSGQHTQHRLKRRRIRLHGESHAVRDQRRGRVIGAVMAVVALAYGAQVWWHVHQALRSHGDVPMGASSNDVRYRLGKPTHEQGAEWTYTRAGQVLTLHFDASGRLDHTRCASQITASDPCPAVLSIGIGADEGDVVDRFGRPDREVLVGQDKVMAYDGLGYAFRLRQRTVVLIEHQAAVLPALFWRQLAWELVP